MRKLFIAITAVMSLWSASAEVTYKYDSSTKTLTFSGTGAVPDVTLWYEDGQFKEWNSREWSDYNEDAEKVVFEEGITSLGGCILNGFVNVTEVKLPSTLTDLGMGAFRYMSSLKSIDLPAGLKTIGERCFEKSGLESIVIPDGVTKFKYETFKECKSLTSVVAKNVTEFGVSTFNQTALKSYDLPEGTTVLPAGLFYRIKTMESIVIPAGVKTIDKGVFSYSNISKVVFKGDKLPEFIEEWGDDYYMQDEEGNVLLDEDGYKRIKSIYSGLGWNAFNGNYNARNFYLSCSAYTDDAIAIINEVNDSKVGVYPLLAADITFDVHYTVKDFKVEQKDCSKNVLTFSANPSDNKCLLWGGSISDGLEDKTVTSFDYEVDGAATLTVATQKCAGSNQVTWSFDESDNTLKISGNEDTEYNIPDYASADATPWAQHADKVENVEIRYASKIGDYAFAGLSKVTSIELSSRPNVLGNYIFANTPSLTKVKFISAAVPTVSANTFSGLGKDVVFEVPCDYLDDYKEAWPDEASRIVGNGEEAKIYSKITGKGKVAYTITKVDCDGTTIRLTATPEEGESFVNWTFSYGDPTIVSGTEEDAEIEVSVSEYLSVVATFTGVKTSGTDGNISWKYDAENNELIISGEGDMEDYSASYQPWEALGEALNTITKVTVEEGVTALGGGAFMSMKGVESVSLPKSLKKIGMGDFYGCASLTSITIPENVESIGAYNFFGYDEDYEEIYVDEIIFKGAVAPTIHENTIENIVEASKVVYPCSSKDSYEAILADLDESQIECSDGTDDDDDDDDDSEIPSMDDITFDPANVCGADEDGANILWAFDEATGTLYLKGEGKMKNYYATRKKAPWIALNVKNVIVGDGITTIGNYAFYGMSSVENVTLPTSLDSISDYAFASATSIKEIVVPEGVAYIGDHAFESLSGDIDLPSTLKEIGEYAFQYCQVKTVEVPESVEKIGHGAFYNSGVLEEVVLRSATPANTGGNTIVTTVTGTRGKVVKLVVPCDAVEAYKEAEGYQPQYIQGEYAYTLKLTQTTDTYEGSDLGGRPMIQQWPDCETGEAIVSVIVNSPYKFSHWEATGVTLTEEESKANPITFTVDDDCVLTAVFRTASDVDDIDADGVVVMAEDGRISVNRDEFQIFDVLGRDVTSVNGTLATGVYVVKVNGKAYKAVVK